MSWNTYFKYTPTNLPLASKPIRRKPTARLVLETLEDRLAPAAWQGFSADGGQALVTEERVDADNFRITTLSIVGTSAGGLLNGLIFPRVIGHPTTPTTTGELFSGTSWTLVGPDGRAQEARPGGGGGFFTMQVASQGTITSPTQLTLSYTLTKTSEVTGEVSTYSETLNLEARRQDVQVKLPSEPDTAFRGTGIIEATPTTQILGQTADSNGRAVFHVRVTNAGSFPARYFLAARAETPLRFATSPSLAVINSAFAVPVRAGEALPLEGSINEPLLQPGQSAEFFVGLERNAANDPLPVLLLSSAFPDLRNESFTFPDLPQGQFAAFDTFRLAVTAPVETPDLLVKAVGDADFLGNGVLEPIAVTQQLRTLTAPASTRATYQVKVENDGTQAARFVLRAPDPVESGWSVRYFNGATPIEQIKTTGFLTDLLQPNASQLLTVEIEADPNAAPGRFQFATVTVAKEGETQIRDKVQMLAENVLIVNTPLDLVDAVDDGVVDVDPSQAGQQISLREAITIANRNANRDTITFNLPQGSTIINVGATGRGLLPEIDHETILDATTQPGGGKVELHGRQAGGLENGLSLNGERITVKGFEINNFGGNAIVIQGGSNHVISNNYLGSVIIPVNPGDPDERNGGDGVRVNGNGRDIEIRDNRIHGNRQLGVGLFGGSVTKVLRNEMTRNALGGIHISGSPSNVVSENVVSLNGNSDSGLGDGIQVSGAGAVDNVISNNTIGLDRQRGVGQGNVQNGINLNAAGTGNTIDGNVIADNLNFGLVITSTDGTNVFSNTFGFAAPQGAENFANFEGAILVEASRNTNIGAIGKGNQIFGHGAVAAGTTPPADRDGIRITGARSTGNKVLGNRVGTNTLGNATTVGHQGNGILITNGASNTTIGGAATGEGNIIVHSGKNGVLIDAGASDNKVLGNLIGTEGTEDHGNRGDGVRIDGANTNLIGGPDTSFVFADFRSARTPEGNVISGNGGNGVQVSGGSDNKIQGNIIGLNAAQDGALANGENGVLVTAGAVNTLIGVKLVDPLDGAVATGAGNLISGNTEAGVRVEGAATVGTRIAGNQIGATGVIAANGVTPAMLANRIGIQVRDQAKVTTIGERRLGRNRITDNRFSGIEIGDVASSTANQFAVTVQNNLITALRGATDAAIAQTGIRLDNARDVVIGATLDAAFFADDFSAGFGNDISENAFGIRVLQSQASFASKNVVIARNQLAGNRLSAIVLEGKNTEEVRIFGNQIGVQQANQGDGIHIEDASNNLIQENRIDNNETGVRISRTGTDNRLARFNGILANTFQNNRKLAIDLVVPNEPAEFDGVSFNDDTDLDEGPNDLQNFVLDDASRASLFNGRTLISVALKTEARARYRVEFFAIPESQVDISNTNGEAARFLGERTVTTNNLGEATIHMVTTATMGLGNRLTATVTRLRTVAGQARFETSEFSSNFTVVAGVDRNFNGVQDAEEDLGTRPPETNGRAISEVTNGARVLVEPVGAQTTEELDLVTLFVRSGVDVTAFNAFRQTRPFDNRDQEVAYIDYKLDNLEVGEKIRVKTTLFLPGFLGTVIAFKADSEGNPVLDARGAPLVFSGDDVIVTEISGSAEIGVEILVEDGGPLDKDGQRDGKITDPIGIMAVDPTDLSATLTGAAAATVGVNQTLTLAVRNTNPATAANEVVAEVTLPPDVDFIAASDGGVFDAVNRVVTFRLGDVAGGATLLRTVTVRPTAAGNLAFPATVAIKGLSVDPNAANDAVVQNVVVNVAPDLPTQATPAAPRSVLTVRRSGGKLLLTGTAVGDAVRIILGRNKVMVIPRNGTVINGSGVAQTFRKVTRIELRTQGGNDTIELVGSGFTGQVILDGGAGRDLYKLGTKQAKVKIVDPEGSGDRVGFSLASGGVYLDLRLTNGEGQQIDAVGSVLQIVGRLESATGSPFDDVLIASDWVRQLDGGLGSNLLVGRNRRGFHNGVVLGSLSELED